MSYTQEQVARYLSKDREAFEEGKTLIAEKLEAETDKAIGLPKDGDEDDLAWLPKSQVHAEEMIDEAVRVFIPEWLAEAESDELKEVVQR